MNTYIIKARYEYLSLSEGKRFTDWFVFDSTPADEKTTNEKIKELKKEYGYIDKQTKLKHEYMLYSYDAYLSDIEHANERIHQQMIESANYFKSDEYKELQKRKRKEARERKQRKNEYMSALNN